MISTFWVVVSSQSDVVCVCLLVKKSVHEVESLLIVGGRDAEAGTVSVRQRGVGDLGAVDLDRFISDITAEVSERRLPTVNEEDN